jgi:D-arginine dehydrogenase
MTRNSQPDVIIIGGGMAGAGLAAHLARHRRVTLIEREAACGLHTTGRAVAMFTPSHGAAAGRSLATASRAFFEAPPAGFDGPLLRPRPALHIARPAQLPALSDLAARLPGGIELTAAATRRLASILRPDITGLLEPDAGDLDVRRLHRRWLGEAQEHGAEIRLCIGDYAIERNRGLWKLQGDGWSLAAPVLVNAAGAWADVVASEAGLAPLRLEPRQRTLALIDPPPVAGFTGWPIVKDVDDRFHFRPFAGKLLIAPADEEPSPPCDAEADPLDIACALMRFQSVADYEITDIRHQWAGLRTFASDGLPVIGWSGEASGFFWFAGLGGMGVQTAPAAAQLAAALLLDRPVPRALLDHGLVATAFGPSRFAAADLERAALS